MYAKLSKNVTRVNIYLYERLIEQEQRKHETSWVPSMVSVLIAPDMTAISTFIADYKPITVIGSIARQPVQNLSI